MFYLVWDVLFLLNLWMVNRADLLMNDDERIPMMNSILLSNNPRLSYWMINLQYDKESCVWSIEADVPGGVDFLDELDKGVGDLDFSITGISSTPMDNMVVYFKYRGSRIIDEKPNASKN